MAGGNVKCDRVTSKSSVCDGGGRSRERSRGKGSVGVGRGQQNSQQKWCGQESPAKPDHPPQALSKASTCTNLERQSHGSTAHANRGPGGTSATRGWAIGRRGRKPGAGRVQVKRQREPEGRCEQLID